MRPDKLKPTQPPKNIASKDKIHKTKKKDKKTKSESTVPEVPLTILPPIRQSDAEPIHKREWINRERVLFVPARGISAIARHWMTDMIAMMPHAKKEAKFQSKRIVDLVDLAESHNCSKLVFIETRKHLLNYVWFVCLPDGPSVKCVMENNSSVTDLRLTGNALKHSRPLVVFSGEFSSDTVEKDEALFVTEGNPEGAQGPSTSHYHPTRRLMREILWQIFGTPKEHPKSQPFIDKLFQFSWVDGRIWFRSYQLDVDESGAPIELGPRFCLKVLNVFAYPFGGAVIYKNPHVLTPTDKRSIIQSQKADSYANRLFAKQIRKSKPAPIDEEDITNSLFV